MPKNEGGTPGSHDSIEDPADYLGVEEFLKALMLGAQNIAENHQHLSALDRATGDGDHGTTMRAVAATVTERLNHGEGSQELSSTLRQIAMALLELDSGAVGPLFSALFFGMSDSATSVNRLDADGMVGVFEGGVLALMSRTKARPGDKTLMCALVPAIEAMRRAVDDGHGLVDVVAVGKTAARESADSTRDMIAKYGRAKYQGERSLGHIDPGAESVALLFNGFAEGLPQRVRQVADS